MRKKIIIAMCSLVFSLINTASYSMEDDPLGGGAESLAAPDPQHAVNIARMLRISAHTPPRPTSPSSLFVVSPNLSDDSSAVTGATPSLASSTSRASSSNNSPLHNSKSSSSGNDTHTPNLSQENLTMLVSFAKHLPVIAAGISTANQQASEQSTILRALNKRHAQAMQHVHHFNSLLLKQNEAIWGMLCQQTALLEQLVALRANPRSHKSRTSRTQTRAAASAPGTAAHKHHTTPPISAGTR